MNRIVNFSSNLKYYRVKNGFTQSQLAERIGYTAKSVSKWENGGALPTTELVIQLAELFCISIDELMFEKTACNYFLGIDGGGTKTVFKLVDDNGLEVNTISKGGCNPNDIGMEKATAVLKEGIREVCRGIPYGKITMFAGLSGGGLTGDNVSVLNRFFRQFGFFAFGNDSDIENLVALSNQTKCILIIMGTGFMVYALNGTSRKRLAGWGQFFDDGGSGYTLGREAITSVLCAGDGTGRKTCMTALLEKRLGQTAQAYLSKFYQGGKRYIASFSDVVFEAAAKEDAVAREILEKNMQFVAHRINTAAAEISEGTSEEISVYFSGGLLQHKEILFPLIEKYISGTNCKLIKLESEPVEGALLRAKKIFAQVCNEKMTER